MHQNLWGYKAKEELHLGVREQEKVEFYCHEDQGKGRFLDLCAAVRLSRFLLSGLRQLTKFFIFSEERKCYKIEPLILVPYIR
jgi:hypothetical protein